MYDDLPTFPGASKTVDELTGYSLDTCEFFVCTRYSLSRTFLLPSDVNAEQVKDFYLSNIPRGWQVPDASACDRMFNVPPGVTPPKGPFVFRPPTNAVILERRRDRAVQITVDSTARTITYRRGGYP